MVDCHSDLGNLSYPCLRFTHFGKVLAASAFWAARIYNWPGNPGNLTEVCCWVLRWSVSRFWTFQDFAGSARSVRNPSDGNLWQQVSFLSSIFWQSMRIYIVGWFISLPLSLWLLVSRVIFVYWIYWIVLHTHVYTNMYIYNILYIYTLYLCCKIICIYIRILVRELYAIHKHLPCFFCRNPSSFTRVNHEVAKCLGCLPCVPGLHRATLGASKGRRLWGKAAFFSRIWRQTSSLAIECKWGRC